ncbi:carbohydrate ABC transporter permease [Demequina capsici]|uniref:Carbohydrate ABC transporter permease n=1 Tax=Demequina capsici TaxID=3075620 RepID=A0AA96F677_9MICO|nr:MULTISPECIES: carbohydrate ABC transporter permease [unclassified Demequina]WNM24444.1 carbohydrate ABC transporter permease [Demequina sp. OYTSA14]WNM27274.1 carbohydrate ABC transporter permease [Demequina sp. PMTSA13]
MTSAQVFRGLREVPKYAFLTIVAAVSIGPLYFMAVSATNTSNDVLASRMLPGSSLIQNWQTLLGQQDVYAAMYHSTVNAVATTVLALVVSSIAGYGFEVYHSRNKDRLMWVLMLAMMIPFAATMIPLFRLFANFGLINSVWAVVLPAIATPLLILMFRQSARSFPHEIIEAARMDGLGELSIFFRMFVPTMRPTYAAAAVITFMAAWNNFLWPKVILVNADYQTMPMLISNFTGGYVIDYGALMLAVLIASLPTIVIFFVLQRSFVAGFTGVVK